MNHRYWLTFLLSLTLVQLQPVQAEISCPPSEAAPSAAPYANPAVDQAQYYLWLCDGKPPEETFIAKHKKKIIAGAAALVGAAAWYLFNHRHLQLEPLLKNNGEPICYLESMQQPDEWSCGHYAVANAAAIEKLLREGKKLDDALLIQEAAKPFLDQLLKDAQAKYLLEGSEMTALAAQLLEEGKVHVLQYESFKNAANFSAIRVKNPRDGDPYIVEQETNTTAIPAEHLPAELTRVGSELQTPADCHHFICRTSEHWALISAHKPDKTPQLVILNSTNSPVTDESAIAKYVWLLYDGIVKR